MEFCAGLERLAEKLVSAGWDVLVTPNLYSQFKAAGLPVVSIAEWVSFKGDIPFPPTLHPMVEKALTMDGTPRIDLVCDVPYPHAKGWDVGGHTLLALGLKGSRLVCNSAEDLERIINHLSNGEDCPRELKAELDAKALQQILCNYLEKGRLSFAVDGMVGAAVETLENGENPYQTPALFFAGDNSDPFALSKFKRISGPLPCFTNMADLDSIAHTLALTAKTFEINNHGRTPFIAVAAKHGNACGMAIDWERPIAAIEKALAGNMTAVWGGEFICNFTIGAEEANTLLSSQARKEILGNSSWMLHVVAAPEFTEEAIGIIGRSQTRKLFENEALRRPSPQTDLSYRVVRGGFLRQPSADFAPDIPAKFAENADSLTIAWCVVASSFHGGNEVAVVKDGMLLGVGGGPSTIDAAKTAVSRAKDSGHDTAKSVFGADAFFPFTDAPETLCDAGCAGGIVPGGGKNDEMVKTFFATRGLSVLYLPEDIRGFCRH